MRLLICTLGRAGGITGAGQTAAALARALRAKGHEVVELATGTPPASCPGWRSWSWHRARVMSFVGREPRFDAIDVPPSLVAPDLADHGFVVARNVQPELRYNWAATRAYVAQLPRRPWPSLLGLVHLALGSARVIAGWRRAGLVLCLGSADLAWMRARWALGRLPLASYTTAPEDSERRAFAAIRHARVPEPGPGLRFLWIGRWAAHKGPAELKRFIAARRGRCPADVFTVAGCGEAGAVELHETFGGDHRVAVRASFERHELLELLASHDVGLFTSRAEGWGLSLQEMLEAGLTVFATAEGAVCELSPYFPQTLRPFPPPPTIELARPNEALVAKYCSVFSTGSMAEGIEAAIVAALRRAGPS